MSDSPTVVAPANDAQGGGRAPTPTNGQIRIGPSRFMAVFLTIINPLLWVGALLEQYQFNGTFREWLYQATENVTVHDWMIRFWVWQNTFSVPVWVWPAALGAIYVFVRVVSTNYYIRGELLLVNHGWFARGSPKGRFHAFEDTIALQLVMDVNIERDLLDLLVGTGTLIVASREAEGGKSHLRHVRNPRRVRDAIMAGSGVASARIIVSA